MTLSRPTRSLFGIALLTLAACASSAAQESAPLGPKAVAPTTIIDLGKHPRGSKVRTEFEIQNTGDAPLTILDTASNCSCLVAEIDPVIAPGESGKVTAEVDTEVLEGPSRAAVTILTNDPENPKILLQVKIESVPYLAAKPSYFRYLVHQGFDAEGAPAAPSAIVIATNPPEFTITSAESTYPGLTVEYREATLEERLSGFDGPQYRVTATLRPDAPVGPLTGFVRLHTTHEKQKLFSIPISGFVRPVVAVTPPRIELGTFSIPEGEEKFGVTIRVQHFLSESKDLQITKIESDLPNLQSTIKDGNTDRDWWVDLWWSSDQVPKGKIDGTVKIFTSNELAPVVELKVEGERVS